MTILFTTAFLLTIPFKGFAQQRLCSDVNNDGEVNIADVNAIIDAILSTNFSNTADVNNDGEVNIADVNAVIDKILNPAPSLQDPGLYMGITGFNQQLYTKDISLLNQDTKDAFTGFVSSLTTKDATVLYYAVDKSLDALDAGPFPTNLGNVALITFTDGLDQGSLMLTEKGYTNDAQYATALSARINSINVHGCPLQAYSIGLKGSDVTNNEMFMTNLRSLASSEDNIALINNMNEIKTTFQEIADNLTKTSYNYSHTLTLTIPGVSNGTRIRFTFDNVSSNTVAQSEKYIEGTFNLSNRSLINVTYHGMTSSSGTMVAPKEVNGVYVTYVFDNLVMDDHSEKIDKNTIQEWYWVPDYSKWQKNSEFTPNSIDSVDVEIVYTSAIVMLVLDCSTSLGGEFQMLQYAASEFITTLANYESYNPSGTTEDYEWVDLGLPSGTLWAKCNVGASVPEEYGDYFAWGETVPKDYYDWTTYKWCNGSQNTMTKYCTKSSYGYNGFTDSKTRLDTEDDAAYVNWGASWRMPTLSQFQELNNVCTWTWATRNGVYGYLVKGPNGNVIFLPAAGNRYQTLVSRAGSNGFYCSCSLASDYSYYCYILCFQWGNVYTARSYREYGFTVRAVRAS